MDQIDSQTVPDAMPVISFCTSCKGREHHLQSTYLRNIFLNLCFYPRAEFVLLNYNSPDGLDEWARSHLEPLISSGRVVYLHESSSVKWNMSHAKNVCHLGATGDVVCNLDADNYIVPDFARHLAEIMTTSVEPTIVSAPPRNGQSWDVCGRIALPSDEFRALGGYNEDFQSGYGLEDTDLLARAERAGLQSRHWAEAYSEVIHHDRAERDRFLGTSLRRAQKESQKVFDRSSRAGWATNRNGDWGKAVLQRNFEDIYESSSRLFNLNVARATPLLGRVFPHTAIKDWLERQRGPLAQAHSTGKALGIRDGLMQLFVRFGRTGVGQVCVLDASFVCEDEEDFLALAVLARFAEGQAAMRLKSITKWPVVGSSEASAAAAIDALEQALTCL